MNNKKLVNLPEVTKTKFTFEHFPTKMQAFIFRNWDIAPVDRIALCLETTKENIEKQARKMGLAPQGDVSIWLDRGYISIIKANWSLIPYEQLLVLLGIDEERLSFVLKEEDFLNIKLGDKKPDCEKICYSELTKEEETRTEEIKKIITDNFEKIEEEYKCKPFAFFESAYEESCKNGFYDDCKDVKVDSKWCLTDKTDDEAVSFMTERFIKNFAKNYNVEISCGISDGGTISIELLSEDCEEEYHEVDITEDKISVKAADSAGVQRALNFIEDLASSAGGPFFDKKTYKRNAVFKTRFIYSFCGLYNDALDVDSRVYCSDELLEEYSKTGINGIWIQGILYRLQKYDFNPKLSKGWEKRVENLAEFISRAKRYGIKIYLYINEPRAMPLSFFEEYSDILGNQRDGYGCLCTSAKPVQDYLAGAIENLCREVPDIGGFFTITRSENITNCYSLNTEMTCPRCKERKSYEVIAEVNEIIEKSAHKVNPKIKVIAWDWSWRLGEFMTSEEIEKCISLMPKGVILQSNRETEIPTHIGGIDAEVNDYSISVCGLSPHAVSEWQYAKKEGYETCAKLQINNSWECSTIPYLPVYSLLCQNVEAIAKEQVNHLMLSWTLGGYPSPNIKIVAELFFAENGKVNPDFDRVYKSLYGADAEVVKKASDIFSEAFKEFPFHIDTLYVGPQNGGVSNLMYLEPTKQRATMTCFAYDDLEHWRAVYPEDVFENQFDRLCKIWESGLELIKDMKDCEFKDIAYATYIQFKSSYNQVRFIRLRVAYISGNEDTKKSEMCEILKKEKELAIDLFRIMRKNPAVGFEAANHYYYTQGMLKEKVLNCEYLLNKLTQN